MDFMNSGALLAIFGYFGFMLKDIPNSTLSMILPRISTSIHWDTSASLVTEYSNRWLMDKDKEGILKRHYQFEPTLSWSDSSVGNINTGKYYLRITRFCIAVVDSWMEAKTGSNMGMPTRFITVTFYGYKSKRYVEEYKNMISEAFSSKDGCLRIVVDKERGSTTTYVDKRPFDTIFTPYNAEIKKLCDKFNKNSDFYKKNGLTAKIGFLFYGPPGSGKSSMARAVASYMDRPLVYVNLNNNDIQQVPGCGSVVLLEDIDCVSMTRTSDNTKGTDMQTLLNYIDGPMTPNNVVFIASTNHIENLDPALIRPGRFDHQYLIDYIDEDMAKEMCRVYETDELVLEGVKFPVSPAVIQEKIIYEKNSLTEEEKKIC